MKRNFRSSSGEIDIVALDPHEEILIFVEVKLRREKAQAGPLEAVDEKKIKRVRETALRFLKGKKINCRGIRFDVIGVEVTEGGDYRIEHVINAF